MMQGVCEGAEWEHPSQDWLHSAPVLPAHAPGLIWGCEPPLKALPGPPSPSITSKCLGAQAHSTNSPGAPSHPCPVGPHPSSLALPGRCPSKLPCPGLALSQRWSLSSWLPVQCSSLSLSAAAQVPKAGVSAVCPFPWCPHDSSSSEILSQPRSLTVFSPSRITCPLAELWALKTGGQGGLRVWLEGMTSPCSQQALCAFTLGSVRHENARHLWPLRGEGGREKGNPGWTTVGCFLSLTAGSAQGYEAVG